MSHNIENEVRTTPEYAAVFALEKWRASQIKKWNEEWLVEKKKRIRDLELSFADRADDLDNKAASLESLGEKLKSGFQALEAQKKDQERRESSFSATQLLSASEHESALQSMQERCRRMVGEVQAKLENERSKNRELEQLMNEQNNQKKMQEKTNSELNEKLLQVQKKDADHAASLAEKDKEIFDLRKELAESRQKTSSLQKELSEAQNRVFKLEENAQFYRSEAKRVVAHHNRLLEEIFKEREEKLKKERESLEYEMLVGGSSGKKNGKNSRGSATANCVDAALRQQRDDEDDDEYKNDDENKNESPKNKKNVSTSDNRSANGIHSELRSMADMIEQLARSIDHAEERERKRDEETAKKVSDAVRESMMESFASQQQEEDEDELIMFEEEEDEQQLSNQTRNDAIRQSFDPSTGNFYANFESDKKKKYLGHRYVSSPEFYELRPKGFHSGTKGGGVFSSVDTGLNESAIDDDDNNNNHNEQFRQPQPQSTKRRKASPSTSNKEDEEEAQSFDKTKTYVDDTDTATAANDVSRAAREQALLHRNEYYASSERIPSSTIRTSSSRQQQQSGNEEDDDDEDGVRLEGDDTMNMEEPVSDNNNNNVFAERNNNNNPNNTTDVLSSLSIPESQNVNEFDSMLDFGPHGEVDQHVVLQQKEQRVSRTQNTNYNNKPPSSTASTNLETVNNNKPKRQASSSSSRSAISRNSPPPQVPVVESEAFLNKLQQNRDRLLETGVYKPGDRIIVEMDNRILEYKQKKYKSAVL